MDRRMIVLATVVLVACTSVPPDTSGIRVVHDKGELANCYSLGQVVPEHPTVSPIAADIETTKHKGGDAMFVGSAAYAEAFVCDPARVAQFRAHDAAVHGVRITNRQDVVTQCKFLTNVTASTEADARTQTVSAGGNLFFVVSDTTRTETTKAASSRTAYTYEVRRLTGEAYACP